MTLFAFFKLALFDRYYQDISFLDQNTEKQNVRPFMFQSFYYYYIRTIIMHPCVTLIVP